jgi:hypothetical protein
VTESDPPRTAGIISRGIAAVIDLVVVGIVIGLLYAGLVLSRLIFNPTAFQLPALNAVFSTTAVLVVSVVYLAGAWSVSGCTPNRTRATRRRRDPRRRLRPVPDRVVHGRRRPETSFGAGPAARHPCGLRAAVLNLDEEPSCQTQTPHGPT